MLKVGLLDLIYFDTRLPVYEEEVRRKEDIVLGCLSTTTYLVGVLRASRDNIVPDKCNTYDLVNI